MLRHLAYLTLIAACGSSVRTVVPPTNRAAPIESFALVPVQQTGGEGLHSGSHTTRTVTGRLELAGTHANLALTIDSFTGYVRCPSSMRGTVQACAVGPDLEPIRGQHSLVLRGEMRSDGGALVGSLADGTGAALAMTCSPSFVGLACTVRDASGRVFGREPPATLSFATPHARRFAIVPRDVAGVGRLSGTIEMTSERAIRVALTVDGGAEVVLPGTVIHQDAGEYGDRDGQSVVTFRGYGYLFTAQTSPTRTFRARCVVKDRITCEVSADPSVLGTGFFDGALVLTPQR